jgi:outer membrane protein TolC
LFDGGRIEAEVQQRRLQSDELAAAYRRSVLGVLQQLETQLVEQGLARRQQALLADEARVLAREQAAWERQREAGRSAALAGLLLARQQQQQRLRQLDAQAAALLATLRLQTVLGQG